MNKLDGEFDKQKTKKCLTKHFFSDKMFVKRKIIFKYNNKERF